MPGTFQSRTLASLVLSLSIACISAAPRACAQAARIHSRFAPGRPAPPPQSAAYRRVQQHLAQGWNTWDVDSVTTQVLLPEGLAIHASLKHNTTEGSDAFLENALIGRLTSGAEEVTPGPHSWNGSYTDLRIAWHGDNWRIQSAHAGIDVVIFATPLPGESKSALPPSIIFTVDFLWNRPGTTTRKADVIETHGSAGDIPVYCTCAPPGSAAGNELIDIPAGGPYFSADLTGPVASAPENVEPSPKSKPRSKRSEKPTKIPSAPARPRPSWTPSKPRWAGTPSTNRVTTASSPR